MKLGLLFSGQGTQHTQMLPWLGSGALVQRVHAILGVPDWRSALHDAPWAVGNRNAQVLLTGLGLAAWAQLSPRLPAPAAIAGYSVGELAAFCAAGVFDAETAIDLAAQRAEAMDRSAARQPGGLLAVTGLGEPAIDCLCVDTGVERAIRVAADAAVLGGARDALAAAEEQATRLGAKCTVLNVSVASHTSAMGPAADAFADVLRGVSVRAPAVTLLSNAAGECVFTSDQAWKALAQQIARTVQWAACLDAMHARRLDCVLEIGPGAALATAWTRRFPDTPARSVDEFRSASAIVDWVLRQA